MRIYKRKFHWHLFVFCGFMLLVQVVLSITGPLPFHPLMLGGVVPFLGIIAWQIQSTFIRLEISTSSIEYKTLFGKKELRFECASGYLKVYSTWIRYRPLKYICLRSKSGECFRIDVGRYREGEDILQWIQTHFQDLNSTPKVEKESIESVSPEKKNSAQIFSAVSLLSVLLLPILALPYQRYLVLLVLPLPLFLITALYWYRGLLIFFERSGPKMSSQKTLSREEQIISVSKSTTSPLWFSFVLSCFFVFFSAIRTFHTNHIWDAMLPNLLIAALLSGLVLVRETSFSFKLFPKSILIFTMFCAYVYGSTIALNAVLDRNNFRTYETQLLSSSKGKGSATLILASWEKKGESRKVSVTKGFVDDLKGKKKLRIRQHYGAFSIPWFEILE